MNATEYWTCFDEEPMEALIHTSMEEAILDWWERVDMNEIQDVVCHRWKPQTDQLQRAQHLVDDTIDSWNEHWEEEFVGGYPGEMEPPTLSDNSLAVVRALVRCALQEFAQRADYVRCYEIVESVTVLSDDVARIVAEDGA